MTDIQQTVYVVEDDEAVRDSLELLLQSDDKPVKTYDSATAFLKSYSDAMAGCIVLDIRMPGMDGMELQKKLNDKHSILPIIFVTGHGDVPMAVDAMKEGAIDFIQKPYREEALLEKIEAALVQDRQQRKSLGEKQEIVRNQSAHGRNSPLPSDAQDGHPLAGTFGPHGAVSKEPYRPTMIRTASYGYFGNRLLAYD
jgi:two-component system response regulator FixJ